MQSTNRFWGIVKGRALCIERAHPSDLLFCLSVELLVPFPPLIFRKRNFSTLPLFFQSANAYALYLPMPPKQEMSPKQRVLLIVTPLTHVVVWTYPPLALSRYLYMPFCFCTPCKIIKRNRNVRKIIFDGTGSFPPRTGMFFVLPFGGHNYKESPVVETFRGVAGSGYHPYKIIFLMYMYFHNFSWIY